MALVAAAPVAAAAPRPIRTVHELHWDGFTIPAGQACTFDVKGLPSRGFNAVTEFPDGRVQHSVRAHGAYINVETGATYPTADNFRLLERFDDVNSLDVGTLSGMAAWSFLPGDVGPYGNILDEAAFYDFVGTIRFTYDTNTWLLLDFRFNGTITDICAALS